MIWQVTVPHCNCSATSYRKRRLKERSCSAINDLKKVSIKLVEATVVFGKQNQKNKVDSAEK